MIRRIITIDESNGAAVAAVAIAPDRHQTIRWSLSTTRGWSCKSPGLIRIVEAARHRTYKH